MALTDGLIFHAPLTGLSTKTGQTLSMQGGDVTFTKVGGIRCAHFGAGAYLTCPDDGFPAGTNPSTLSIWVNYEIMQNKWERMFGYGTFTADGDSRLFGKDNTNVFYFSYMNINDILNIKAYQNQWRHLLVTFDGTMDIFYNNSYLQSTRTMSGMNTVLDRAVITTGYNGSTGYLADARIWNRVLSQDEIYELWNDFTQENNPTAVYLSVDTPQTGDKGLLIGDVFLPFAKSEGTSGGSIKFYKCASVDTATASSVEGETLVMTIDSATFTFHLLDATVTGDGRVWGSQANENYYNTVLYLKRREINAVNPWAICSSSDTPYYFTPTDNFTNPWDTDIYWDDITMLSNVTVSWNVSSGSSGSEASWTGYKAVFDSTAGTWSFEKMITAGLTYTSVIPLVDHIYTSDALIQIASMYQGIAEGLIHHFPFAENLQDSITGNTLTVTGTGNINYTTYSGRTGLYAGADNSYTYACSDDFNNDPFAVKTLAFWFYPQSGSGWDCLVWFGGIEIRRSDNTHQIDAGNQNNYYYPDGIATNAWNHIAFVWTGTDVEIYINGVADAGNPANWYNYISSIDSLEIGNSGGYSYNGLLSDVKIYNRALSATELAELYEA